MQVLACNNVHLSTHELVAAMVDMAQQFASLKQEVKDKDEKITELEREQVDKTALAEERGKYTSSLLYLF